MGLTQSAWAAGGVATVLYGLYRGLAAWFGQRAMSAERRAASPTRRAGLPVPPVVIPGAPSVTPGDPAATPSVTPGGPPATPSSVHPEPPAHCYVVTLNDGEHHDSTVLKFDKGTRIRFAAGSSLLGRKVLFYINYTFGDSEGKKLEAAEFVRSQYACLPWQRLAGDRVEAAAGGGIADTEHFCEVTLRRAGSFHYYFQYDTASDAADAAGSGWVQCRARRPGSLVALTVLSKCLGPLPRWWHALRLAHYANYNMIHFTPVQELGGSRSSYSIAEQLRLAPSLASPDLPAPTFQDLEDLLVTMRKEWNMASICDVVLNHTANESSWLRQHPEATYSCATTPRLRPAALLDAALLRVRCELLDARQLQDVREAVCREADALRLYELYACDVHILLQDYRARALNRVPAPAWGSAVAEDGDDSRREELKLIQDPLYRRHNSTVDIELALHLYHRYEGSTDAAGGETLDAVCERGAAALRRCLTALNDAAADTMRGHLRHAVDNVIAHATYERLADDGPKIKEMNDKHPLVTPYFLWPDEAWSCPVRAEEAALGVDAALVMAHNGWVMGADPLVDFAASGDVYLRRELVAWGDSVKLRYGAAPADSPWLWGHMRDYVELSAELFDGLRLDNCHSTPVHVAQYMMDCARNVKPDLFVVAELFTDSDLVDNLYVNRLGLDALIREGMAAWSAEELGRLVHRYGGAAAGSLHGDTVTQTARSWDVAQLGVAACGDVAPAMFLDVTHDNRSPIQDRSVWNIIPTAACICAANCAVGSTRGLDELVPHQIHVVDEERPYALWEEDEGKGRKEGAVGPSAGVLPARRLLNKLHQRMAKEGYDEVYVDQVDDATVVITRHNPNTRESILVVCVNAFSPPELLDSFPAARRIQRALRLEGNVTELLLDVELERVRDSQDEFVRCASYINGLEGYRCVVRCSGGGTVSACDMFRSVSATRSVLEWGVARSGRVVALHVSLPHDARHALQHARHVLLHPPAFTDLDLLQLNYLLYRSDAEERSASGGSRGVYNVPGSSPLVYAGLRGVASELQQAWRHHDLAHPLLENMRQGDWLVQYTVSRLEGHPAASRVAAALGQLAALPRFLQPAYTGAVLLTLCAQAEGAALSALQPHRTGGALRHGLALTSVQLLASLQDAPLPAAPRHVPSLSAGLPHFATGYMRCWGRDTFVALPGIMLHEGRFQEARWHIVSFASCLRHGLIPNLLDRGVNARYNCRDAVWWWLHAIRRYCDITKSFSILSESVPRLFPTDSSPALDENEAPRQPLQDIMQEALDKHFQGQVFRERNAGQAIDAHMTDQGFNVQIGIDPETGFPFGGNEWNCGTWMDKMGSSEVAGNKGRPATPRDGSAIELVALAHATARWLHDAHRGGHYTHAGVARLDAGVAGVKGVASRAAAWSWEAWAARLEANVERYYWVGRGEDAGGARPDLVHRRAIYKDTHNATHAYTEYQLRPNQAIAIAMSPSLFSRAHAQAALDSVESLLLGPLGLKTLDPADWAYRPDYRNDDHSSDPATAHGFNYHQGPEWTWPLGLFLLARLLVSGVSAASRVRACLRHVTHEIITSHARGLPELTDAAGTPCRYSCTTQAWSNATFIEVLEELEKLERSRTMQAD